MLKNLIGQQQNLKGAKKQGDASSISNLLSSKSNQKLSKGQKEEFSKLLQQGESHKGKKTLLASNEAQAKKPFFPSQKQAQNVEVKETLAQAPTLDGFKNVRKSKLESNTQNTLFSTLNSQANTGVKHSDLDNILGTKNIVDLQKAKTTLASRLGEKKSLPKMPQLAAKGIETGEGLGKNTQAILNEVQVNTKITPQLLKTNTSKPMAKKPLNTIASSNDFLMNRQIAGQAQNLPKQVSGQHLNKFSNESSNKSQSIIRVKPEMAATESVRPLELEAQTARPVTSVQNNLIGALGANNQTSNFRPEINLAKSSQVIDLSSVSNPDQLINEVTNYIEMNRIENSQTLQVTVKHNDLGQFNVVANKDMNGMIALNIETSTTEAKEFFKENEVKLLKNLDMKGVRVADFKIQTASNGQMSDFASQSENFKNDKRNSERQADKISTLEKGGNEFDFTRQLNGEDSLESANYRQAREGRQRRWQEYSERLGA